MRRGLAVIVAVAAGCGSSGDGGPAPAPEVGHALADGVATAVAASARLAAPFRCAELSPSPTPGPDPKPNQSPTPGTDTSTSTSTITGTTTMTVAGRSLAVEGAIAHLGAAPKAPRDTTVVLGVVADARGATEATLAQIAAGRAAFAAEKVELVVSLGGLGTTEPELTAVLRALTDGAAWPVIAIPGDREAIPAHRAAVAALAAAGTPVLDGSRVRLVDLDGALVATFPGAEHPSRLLAGDDGCVHAAADATALAALLGAHTGLRIWAGHAPPRQGGDSAGDRSLGGVHVGELSLASALPAARAHVVLHGLVDQAALGPATGLVRLTPDATVPFVLGAGPLEAMPIPGPRGAAAGGGALVVRASPGALTWKRLRLPLPGSAARVDRPRGRRIR